MRDNREARANQSRFFQIFDDRMILVMNFPRKSGTQPWLLGCGKADRALYLETPAKCNGVRTNAWKITNGNCAEGTKKFPSMHFARGSTPGRAITAHARFHAQERYESDIARVCLRFPVIIQISHAKRAYMRAEDKNWNGHMQIGRRMQPRSITAFSLCSAAAAAAAAAGRRVSNTRGWANRMLSSCRAF